MMNAEKYLERRKDQILDQVTEHVTGAVQDIFHEWEKCHPNHKLEYVSAMGATLITVIHRKTNRKMWDMYCGIGGGAVYLDSGFDNPNDGYLGNHSPKLNDMFDALYQLIQFSHTQRHSLEFLKL